MSRTLQPCGTRAARRRHTAKNETCGTCFNPRTPAPCGTYAARRRHKNNGEQCETCAKVIKPCTYRPQATARTLQPCGTRAAYRRHRDNNETPCNPCETANTEYSETLRRRHGVQPKGPTTHDLIEDINFLLKAGEGEQRILNATGYTGRPNSLRIRLTQAGEHQLARLVFNGWELAA